MSLTVVAPGPLTLVQDAGRPGRAWLGLGRSGAADRGALALANRLLGNAAGCAGLEVLLGGLQVRAEAAVTVCLTGAPAPAEVDGRPVGQAAALRLTVGQVLRLGAPAVGLRTYLGVRGGLDVAPVLGSRSRDTLAGLGPAPLVAGDVLAVGRTRSPLPDLAQAPVPPLGPALLRLLPGPRRDWLTGPLRPAGWMVGPDSDRVGVRLLGVALPRREDELPPEGLLPGAVQLPPDGQPVLFLADAPVTGGYPVIGVLDAPSLDRAAQLRPGDPAVLRWSHGDC